MVYLSFGTAELKRRLGTHFGLVYGVYRHFQQYFNYIVAVSFIGGGNRNTQWKSPTCRKSLTNFFTYIFFVMLYRVHPPWARFELTTLMVIGTDCTSSCKSYYHQPRQPPWSFGTAKLKRGLATRSLINSLKQKTSDRLFR